MPRASESSAFGRSVVLFAQAALVALGIASVVSRIAWLDPSNLTRNDFTENYVSAKEWSLGGDPYGKTRELIRTHVGPDSNLADLQLDHRNPHPPALILLYRPLSALPYETARGIWLVLSSAVLVVAMALFLRRLGWDPRGAWALAAGSLAIPVSQKLIQFAQFEGIIVALLIAGWMALKEGNDRRAGMALGLAAAFKFYPAFLVVPLLRNHRGRTVGIATATAGLVSVVSILVMGLEETKTFLQIAGPDNYEFYGSAPFNVSLFAVPIRWLTAGDWRSGLDVPVLAWTLAAVIMAGAFLVALRTPARISGDVFWAAVPVMLLATPLAWDFSLVLCVPVLFVVLRQFVDTSSLPSIPLLIVLLAIAVGIPLGFAPAQPGTATAVQFLAYMPPTIALLAFVIADWRGPRRVPVRVAPATSTARCDESESGSQQG